MYRILSGFSNLGHQILLPDLISKANQNGKIDQVSEMIEGICNRRPNTKKHLALLAIMDIDIDEKIVMQSLYEYLSNELYFSELLNFNNMESISELMSKELINNIRVKLHQKTLNKFKYLCKNCGYKTIKLSWQCPTCRGWELSTPINFIRNH